MDEDFQPLAMIANLCQPSTFGEHSASGNRSLSVSDDSENRMIPNREQNFIYLKHSVQNGVQV